VGLGPESSGSGSSASLNIMPRPFSLA